MMYDNNMTNEQEQMKKKDEKNDSHPKYHFVSSPCVFLSVGNRLFWIWN